MHQDFEYKKLGEIAIVDINLQSATLESAQFCKDFISGLISNGNKKIIVNCSHIMFMDSTFLGALVFSLKRSASNGGDIRLVLSTVDSPIWTMFETTRMFKVFKTFPDIGSAVKSF